MKLYSKICELNKDSKQDKCAQWQNETERSRLLYAVSNSLAFKLRLKVLYEAWQILHSSEFQIEVSGT